MKIEHWKIFRGSSKSLKNISRPINICLKHFINPTKTHVIAETGHKYVKDLNLKRHFKSNFHFHVV